MLVEHYRQNPGATARLLMAISSPMQLRNFTGGQWTGAVSGATFDTPDPHTGNLLFRVPRSQGEDVGVGLESLTSAWPYRETTREISPERWSQVLMKWADLIETNWEPMVAVMQDTFPIERSECDAELALTVRFMRSMTGNAIRWLKEGSVVQGTGGQTATTVWQPRGLCGLITPFNFTVEIPALQIVGALVAGNLLVVKPHELTGAPVQALLELGLEAGLDPKVFCLIHGYGAEVAKLGTTGEIDFGVFTGSTAVFAGIHNAGGAQWRGETSGVNPCVVGPGAYAEADFAAMVARGDGDRYRRAGQVCARRAIEFVHISVADRLTDGVRELAGRRVFTDGTNSPVLSWSNFRLAGRLESLVGLGGQVMFGGQPAEIHFNCQLKDPFQRFGYGFFQPTLVRLPIARLSDPAVVHAIQTECFGPVHTQFVWETPAELDLVRRFVRGNPHKLTAGVVSRDPEFLASLRRSLRGYGVVYWGVDAGNKGAPDWMRFAPSGPLAACIGGRLSDVREVWMSLEEQCYRPGPAESGLWSA